MKNYLEPLDLAKLKVYPLSERRSLSALESLLIDPAQSPSPSDARATEAIVSCAARIAAARKRGASVILMYGAHLVKNGALAIVNRLIERGWITHLGTNGAGSIHDWELAY